MLRCRKSGVLTGLPDGYGRGRVTVTIFAYGLIVSVIWYVNVNCNLPDLQSHLGKGEDLEASIRLREGWRSIVMRCCGFRKWRRNMALISLARRRMRRKRWWLNFASLAAVKSRNGGAMSLDARHRSSISTLGATLKLAYSMSSGHRELIDHFIMKIRMVRFLRYTGI